MKHTTLLLVLSLALCTSAQKIINFNIGPLWPRDFSKNEYNSKAAWSSAIEVGTVFDKRLALGGKVDFLWEIANETSDSSNTIDQKSRLFMFPVSFFLHFDPIPQYTLHPVIRGQLGYNSMVIEHSRPYDDSLKSNPIQHVDGYYFGFISKLGIDAVVDIGKQAAFFTGFEYQFAPRTQHKNDNGSYESINMSAPGIRMGLSVLF